MLSPQDASARGIASGDRVEVRSRVGSITVPVEVTDALMPGVAACRTASVMRGPASDRCSPRPSRARA